MTVEDIYDFETVLPKALAQSLSSKGLVAKTVADAINFQETRPRCEVKLTVGGAFNPPVIDPTTIPAGGPVNAGRNLGWNGSVQIWAITDPDPPGKTAHSVYRAKVRNACATLMNEANGTYLANHKIQRMVETSTQHGIRQQDGYEQSTINFDLAFTIQTGVWVQMTGTGTN